MWTFRYHRSSMDLKYKLNLLNWNEKLIREPNSARTALAVSHIDKCKMIIIKWWQWGLTVQSISYCCWLNIISGINTTSPNPCSTRNQTIIIVSLQNSWLMNGLFIEHRSKFDANLAIAFSIQNLFALCWMRLLNETNVPCFNMSTVIKIHSSRDFYFDF